MSGFDWEFLGESKKGSLDDSKLHFFQKREVYKMHPRWVDDIARYFGQLGDCIVAGAPFGGPVAITKDTRGLPKMAGRLKQRVSIYTSAGKPLGDFEWDDGRSGVLFHMCWSSEQSLICVSKEGFIQIYDLFGKFLYYFALPDSAMYNGLILKVVDWGAGLAFLISQYNQDESRSLAIWVVNDLNDPVCVEFANTPISEDFDEDKEIAMEVIPTTLSPIFKVIIAKNNLVMHFGPKKQVNQQRMANTPYARFLASPDGKKLAVYSTKEKTGSLFVMDTNLDESPSKINEFFNSRPIAAPAQMAWCGEKSVCLYWTTKQIAQSRQMSIDKKKEKEKKKRETYSYLVVVSPEFTKKVSFKYTFEGDIHLIPEVDGVRIITSQTCEFLSRVPDPTLEIFKIGALSSAAQLYDAYNEYERKIPNSIKNMRAIPSNELEQAVRQCMKAATFEFDTAIQSKLLNAAAYGKAFCNNFKHEKFLKTCMSIRVLNSVRAVKVHTKRDEDTKIDHGSDVGIPLTYQQYKRLCDDKGLPTILIDRLVNMLQYRLAIEICKYMNIKPTAVYAHWACSKVRSGEDRLFESILESTKEQDLPFATVATSVYRLKPNENEELALRFLNEEPDPAEHVPLLLEMGKAEMALEKALNSSDADVILMVLLYMRARLDGLKKKEQQMIITSGEANELKIIYKAFKNQEQPIARRLIATYCKSQDYPFLQENAAKLKMKRHVVAYNAVQSLRAKTAEEKKKYLLQMRASLRTKNPNYATDAKAIDQQILLIEYQTVLDQYMDTPMFLGLDLTDTVFYCIMYKFPEAEQEIREEFDIKDSRYWHIKINALIQSEQWTELEAFAKEPSPIGYKPFVDECMKYGYETEAIKYAKLVPEASYQVDFFIKKTKVPMFKEAIQAAVDDNNTELLQSILLCDEIKGLEFVKLRNSIERKIEEVIVVKSSWW